MTTTYFGLSVKNVSVQVSRTLDIFVEHDPYTIINGSANQTSRIVIFSDLAFNIYGTSTQAVIHAMIALLFLRK